MKRLLIFILFFFVFLLCGAQEPCVMDLIKKNDTTYKNGDQKPFSGEFKEYYPGKIKIKGQYLNGLKQGKFEYYNLYDCDSIVNYQGGRKNGLKETFERTWYINSGVYIALRENYINDTLEGNSYRWMMGQLESSTVYRRGKIISSQYYPVNDSINDITFYIQGEHNGEIKRDFISAKDTIQIELCGIIYGDNTEIPYKCDTLTLNNKYKIISFNINGQGSDTSVNSKSNFITGPAKSEMLYNAIYISVLIEAYGVQYKIPERKINIIN